MDYTVSFDDLIRSDLDLNPRTKCTNLESDKQLSKYDYTEEKGCLVFFNLTLKTCLNQLDGETKDKMGIIPTQ